MNRTMEKMEVADDIKVFIYHRHVTTRYTIHRLEKNQGIEPETRSHTLYHGKGGKSHIGEGKEDGNLVEGWDDSLTMRG